MHPEVQAVRIPWLPPEMVRVHPVRGIPYKGRIPLHLGKEGRIQTLDVPRIAFGQIRISRWPNSQYQIMGVCYRRINRIRRVGCSENNFGMVGFLHRLNRVQLVEQIPQVS